MSDDLNFDQKCRMVTKNLGMHYYDWIHFDEESMCELAGIDYSDYQKWCSDMGQSKVRQIRNSGAKGKYTWTYPIPKLREDITKDHPGMWSIPQLKFFRESAEYWNNQRIIDWLNQVKINSSGMYRVF